MENLNTNQKPNEIVGVPEFHHEEGNIVEHTALPVDQPINIESDTSPVRINKTLESKSEEVESALIAQTTSDNKLQTVKKILSTVKDSLDAVLNLLEVEGSRNNIQTFSKKLEALDSVISGQVVEATALSPELSGKIVEGVFDGEHMVSSDGQIYNIPPNYASKSKLVEGDLLKLTINPKGAFIYKQIGPIERERARGTLLENKETDEYAVTVNNKVYRVLKASVSYFKGEEGDEVVLLLPKSLSSGWGAVENIIKKGLTS